MHSRFKYVCGLFMRYPAAIIYLEGSPPDLRQHTGVRHTAACMLVSLHNSLFPTTYCLLVQYNAGL